MCFSQTLIDSDGILRARALPSPRSLYFARYRLLAIASVGKFGRSFAKICATANAVRSGELNVIKRLCYFPKSYLIDCKTGRTSFTTSIRNSAEASAIGAQDPRASLAKGACRHSRHVAGSYWTRGKSGIAF
jgi:hypothetical protein